MQKRVTKDGGSKVAAFFKRNVYYVLMIVCVVAIGTMITVAAVVNKEKGGGTDVVAPPGGDDKPVEKPIEFILSSPVGNIDILKNVALDKVVLDKTTGDFTGHGGVDLAAKVNTAVVAPFAGVVESVVADSMWGAVVTIDHGNGYKSTLKLMKDVSVVKGKVLAKGDAIGKVSDTAMKEIAEGAHIHYELTKGGTLLDPMQFMPGGEK